MHTIFKRVSLKMLSFVTIVLNKLSFNLYDIATIFMYVSLLLATCQFSYHIRDLDKTKTLVDG